MIDQEDPTGIGAMAEGVARVVFSPTYYEGPWWVSFKYKGRRRRKVCSNHSTARAWVNYFRRKGWAFRLRVEYGKVMG